MSAKLTLDKETKKRLDVSGACLHSHHIVVELSVLSDDLRITVRRRP